MSERVFLCVSECVSECVCAGGWEENEKKQTDPASLPRPGRWERGSEGDGGREERGRRSIGEDGLERGVHRSGGQTTTSGTKFEKL